MERWSGKVAVVTGASTGIGKEVAKLLLRNGVRVVATAKRMYSLQELEKEGKGTGLVKGIPCDARVESQVQAVFSWAEQNWGPVSILFNNTGYLSIQPLQRVNHHRIVIGNGDRTYDTGQRIRVFKQHIEGIDCDVDELRKMFDSNVIGLSLFAKEALRSMKSNKITEAHIINVNSYAGHIIYGMPGMGPYCASKNAVTVLTESLRRELGPKNRTIKVTSISPGLTDTELKCHNHLPEDAAKLQARDIAEAVIYILSTPPGINVTELTIMAVGDVLH